MKIYLDVSCLNRPFDDQRQDRVRLEAEAVRIILERCERGEWHHVSSDMAALEIDVNPDADQRRKVRALLPRRGDIIELSAAVFARADELNARGLAAADAVHVAAAEAHAADVLLTCDDRMLRVAQRLALTVRVENPVDWLREHEDAANP